MEIQEIKKYLVKKYNPKVILLTGSRASEESRNNSDWDFILVSEGKLKSHREEFEGELLDIQFYKPSLIDSLFKISSNTPFLIKVILDDGKKTGKSIAKKFEEMALEGPQEMDLAEIENRKIRLKGLINKIAGLQNRDLEFSYYLFETYIAVTRYWFEFNKKWIPTPKNAYTMIENEDKDFHKLLLKLITGSDKIQKIATLNNIYDRLFGNPEV